MNELSSVLITGLAVSYVIELLVSLTSSFISSRIVKLAFTLPLSILSNYLLGLFGWQLIIFGAASSCIALTVIYFVNRPQVIPTINRR